MINGIEEIGSLIKKKQEKDEKEQRDINKNNRKKTGNIIRNKTTIE